MHYIGIDSCRAGWFWVALADGPAWAIGLAANARVLATLAGAARRVLIDIPIGLPDTGPAERQCDRAARVVLGRPRSASVFRVPVRAALSARDYLGASRRNRRHTGVGLSRQVFGILPKIRAIDRLLRTRGYLRGRLCETHPEVCLWSFNGRHAMAHNKKTAAGRRERLAVLRAQHVATDAIVRAALECYPRRKVGFDDILDALVAAVTARHAIGQLRTLPASSPRDVFGLPMEIVCAVPVTRRSRRSRRGAAATLRSGGR